MNIVLDQVSKTFINRTSSLTALATVTLTVTSGEFVCIIGPSGCGKSTLLRLIADQIAPTGGTIHLDNKSPKAARTCKSIAWMAQQPALLPWQTVLDNVRLPLLVNRRHQHPAPSPIELLNSMGLSDFATAYPSTLSGGMQQRVALARALATGASLWLMDEPFAALDELTREALTEEVFSLWMRYHPTVLWVTHQIAEAARLADRIVVMTARPGNIRAIVSVPQPRPRDETSPEIVHHIRKLRSLLRGKG
ncbi:MAG: ABC transporter ATP-binding protein [Anaerolineae bacterium]|nr:ABC transporter ATP-binding protein [Anaerolineae bacterium]